MRRRSGSVSFFTTALRIAILATLASSFAIGHMKIDRFDPVTHRVRLNIVVSSGEARIRELQLFSLDGAAK